MGDRQFFFQLNNTVYVAAFGGKFCLLRIVALHVLRIALRNSGWKNLGATLTDQFHMSRHCPY